MGEDSQIQKMKAYKVQSVKELLAADLEKLILEIKPLSSMLSKLHSTNLLLNINCNWHYDGDLVDSLKDEEIEKLIKKLMHYEKISFAGSVSAIPNLLRKLKIRDYKILKMLLIGLLNLTMAIIHGYPQVFLKIKIYQHQNT